jgi:23S rRNA (guanosine2251-2'-O)-methyltransferase
LNKKFIFGINPVEEALDRQKTIDKVFVSADSRNPRISALLARLREAGIPYSKVPAGKLTQMVSNPNHQGLVATYAPVSFQSWEELVTAAFEAGRDPFLLVLDGITDVRNFGAILRTAACAGVDAVVVPARGGAAIGMDSIKTSAGAVFKVPVCRVEHMSNAVQKMKESGLSIAGATEKGQDNLFEVRLTGPMALVLGSEEKGMHPEIIALCDRQLRIPMPGVFDSLNVSVAGGILLFEVLRQRSLQA